MKINMAKLHSLSPEERIIADSIINRFEIALSYYYDKCLENPNFNDLMEFESKQ